MDRIGTLAAFGLDVLELLERCKEWDADTINDVSDLACNRGLADMGGPDGYFRRIFPDPEAPRVGDHVERDLY